MEKQFLVFILLSSTIIASGCAGNFTEGFNNSDSDSSPEKSSMGEILRDLSQAKIKLVHAKMNGIPYENGKVRVRAELKPGTELKGDYLPEKSQYGTSATGWLDVEDIEEFASLDGVRVIRVNSGSRLE